MKIYTQRISQTLAEQIAQTYYGNVVTSKVKEDIIICRTYSAETLDKASEEVFSKTSYEKIVRLLYDSDTEFGPVTEWFNKDKAEIEASEFDIPEVKSENNIS